MYSTVFYTVHNVHVAVLVNYILVFCKYYHTFPSGSMTLDDVGVIGLDFTFYLNHAHHTVILDTILEKNNNHMGKFKVLSPSV